MGNGAQGTMGYRGNGVQGYGVQKVWGICAMRHISNGGNGVQGLWSTRAMGQMGNGVHAMGYIGMGYRGYGAHG